VGRSDAKPLLQAIFATDFFRRGGLGAIQDGGFSSKSNYFSLARDASWLVIITESYRLFHLLKQRSCRLRPDLIRETCLLLFVNDCPWPWMSSRKASTVLHYCINGHQAPTSSYEAALLCPNLKVGDSFILYQFELASAVSRQSFSPPAPPADASHPRKP
jgi:hypothetical protein